MSTRAFSLVELSIVLVILGLLTGGILAGQSLINAAEMRRLTTELPRTVTAIHTFRDKYMALPGDMTNAFNFWGATAGCTNALVSTAPYTGCNGNGNGQFNDNALWGEDLRAYQFMALAGLIEGSYTGSVMPTGNKRQFGRNLPAAMTKNAGWWLNHLTTAQFGRSGNRISLGMEGSEFIDGNGGLLPEQVWNIDSKLDDGRPSTGRLTVPQSQTTCYDTTSLTYTLSSQTATCGIMLWLD